MEFVFSKLAKKDLENIYFYTYSNFGKIQADVYNGDLERMILFISQSTFEGKDASDIKKGYKKILVNNHIILYKINIFKNIKVLNIIRILHQKMDIQDNL